MNKEKIEILLVEDNPDDALLLEECVCEINEADGYGLIFELKRVSTFGEARAVLETHDPDLILLDLSLPDSDGIDTVYKFESYLAEIPVIVLTGLSDSEAAVKSIRIGIQDYLVKGRITRDLLFRAVLYAIERHKMVTVIQSLAMVDELTGLYNRRGFMKLARHTVNLAKRKGYGISLLFADLDCMKRINDTWGHREGDRALRMTASVLKKSFRESDIVARIGGDEFVVMATGSSSSLLGSSIIMERVKKNIEEVKASEPHEFDFSLSFGVLTPEPGEEFHIEQLIEKADELMYEEKKRKKG
jgi:diguanylate cyclase (GGDEF)-like protein